MQDFQQIADNLAYLGYLLSGSQWLVTALDLLLVTITFFLILVVIRHSRAAVLLRGGLLLSLLLVVITALLPLPTFDWLLLGALLVGLVATPMIFQPELRRGLEQLGRTIGFLSVRPTELVHRVAPVLVRAATSLSERRIGALMILERETSLEDVISTGVPLHAELSTDLLETIFHDKTPLHDGAVIIRDDEIVAAACVLPLSEQTLPAGMHQGTRHRAALGISEQTDAMSIVVSEETGHISVAQRGRLNRNLDGAELRERLFSFYDPRQFSAGGRKGANNNHKRTLRQRRLALPPRAQFRRLLTFAVTFLLAAVLAVAAWLLVVDQVNPPQTKTITGVELRPANLPKDMVMVTQPPAIVDVAVQAPQALLDNLETSSFRASIDLANLASDVHRLNVQVRSSDNRVRVLSVEPSALDVELQPLASRVVTINVVIPDRDSLPFSYEVGPGEPAVSPNQVSVQGPAAVLEQLVRAEVTVALRGAKSTVQEERLVVLKDSSGKSLVGLTTDPDSVQVTVPIRQRFNTRDAAVHAVITGTVASGYWISNISVEPKTVTLLGSPTVLNEMSGFVDTVPIDVSGAAGEIARRVPLAPPAGVSALNERGVTEGSVEVRITVMPQMGNLRLTVPVDVTGVREGVTASKSPASVDVLLSGPLPVLDQVNADPKLVRVLVDVSELSVGSHEVTPTLIAPGSLKATVLPATVQIRLERPTPAASAPGDDALSPGAAASQATPTAP